MSALPTFEIIERRARRRWVTFIVGFFALQVVLWSFALHMVQHDPSHAVVEDYDQRALQWDEHRAQQAASVALGWRAAVVLHPASGPVDATIEVTLTDRSARAIAADTVVATMFHQAAAAHRQTIALTRIAPGVFVGGARLDRPGKWRIKIDASQGIKRYASTQIHELPTEAAG